MELVVIILLLLQISTLVTMLLMIFYVDDAFTRFSVFCWGLDPNETKIERTETGQPFVNISKSDDIPQIIFPD